MPGFDEIKYNVEAMKQQAQEIIGLADELRDEANNMNTIISELDAEWAGKEYDNFLEEYEQFKGFQESFAVTVEGFGKYIDASADRAEAADSEASSAVENLIPDN